MADSEKINLAQLKERYKKGLRIPEIQRDYVMGAGGKRNKNSKDKLTCLLDAMLEKCKAHEKFDFSSIIAYCKDEDCENAFLDIYDGQQRLTTLLLLVLYKLRQEESVSYRDYHNWYYFSGRPVANEILGILTEENGLEAEVLIEKIEVRDFTSFSMKKLLEKISERDKNGRNKYDCVTSEYLLHQVKFDKVEIGSQNEIEQFFMDLNSGIKLKEYELYKAKLIHHIGDIRQKCSENSRRDILTLWAYKLDNEWLDAFKKFASYSHPAEEYEIAFIRYCFEMYCRSYHVKEEREGFGHLNGELLEHTYHIMESVSRIHFADIECKDKIYDNLLYFSWGNSKAQADKEICAIRYHNYDKRGVAYNLGFEAYEKQLYWVIKEALLDKRGEMYSDAVLWCYISTLIWQREELQKEYLRLVKILLNHNIAINKDAWYECQKKGQYMYYCRNIVCGIPQYYGEHKEIKVNEDMIDDILSLNIRIVKNGEANKISGSDKDMTFYLMDLFLASENEKIRDIVGKRKSHLESYPEKYSDYLICENVCLGIGNPDRTQISACFASGSNLQWRAEVELNWRIRGGGVNKQPYKCWIIMQCKIDWICSHFNFSLQDWTVKSCSTKIANEDRNYLARCFWDEGEGNLRPKIIRDRKTPTAATYIANKKEEWNVSLGQYVEFWEYAD